MGSDVAYWLREFEANYANFDDEFDGDDAADCLLERAVESFEIELRDALRARVREIIEEREADNDEE